MFRLLLWILIFPGKRKDFILAKGQGRSTFHPEAGLFKKKADKEAMSD